ncbi:helix-turn-helix domain-containing protein [Kribbella hippodromi]
MEESQTPVLDVLLHPVRLRIVQRVLGREVTTTDLKRDLPDIPATTLYRHVAALIDAGYLTVLRERKIRGTTERTLGLDKTKGHMDQHEARAMTPDQHRQLFLMMLTRLAADFDRVIESGDLYPRMDHLGYLQLALYLTPEDMTTFRTEFHALVEPYLQDAPGRARVALTLFALPDS